MVHARSIRLVLPALLLSLAASAGPPAPGAKVPITTANEEARALFLRGRDLNEKLRGTDAHALFLRTVELDPDFATGWLAVANTAASAKEFFAALEKAVALADKASEGERLAIRAAQAGATSDPAGQLALLTQVVALYPDDERAHTALGNFTFAQQEWAATAQHLGRATELAPSYSPPYNQLGYALRFQGRYAEAEAAFQKYVSLLPDDPNPLDSLAELQMKMGRFDESIATYRKALAIDPHFVASLVGIGHDQLLQGKGDEARKTFRHLLTKVARNDGERRQALFWVAMSFIHEGKHEQALAAAREEEAIALKLDDRVARSQDLALMGNILLQAGKPKEAGAKFEESVRVAAGADTPARVKEAAARNSRFNLARVALARGDLAGARALAGEYRALVLAQKVPFEVWQSHELDAMVALAAKDPAAALAELAQANPQNPRVTWLTAQALLAKGDAEGARALAAKVAAYNEITNPNYAYVRAAARQLARQAGRAGAGKAGTAPQRGG